MDVTIIQLLFLLFFLFNALLFMVFSINSYNCFNPNFPELTRVLSNWHSPYLLDAKVSKLIDNCSYFGNDFRNIFSYQWPGTKDGCDCANATLENRGIKQNSCSDNLLKAGCTNITMQPSITMNQWILEQEKVLICGKFANDCNYHSIFPQQSCSKTQKQCGENDQKVCVAFTQECPITTLEFNSSTGIYFKRNESNKLPLSEFRISATESVCEDNLKNNIEEKDEDYSLLEIIRRPCEKTDPRFENLNVLDEESFFQVNTMQFIIASLPQYNLNKQYKWSLFARPYIIWKQKCSEQFPIMLEIANELNELKDSQKGLKDAFIVLFVALLVIFILFLMNFLDVRMICLKGTLLTYSCIQGRKNRVSNNIYLSGWMIAVIMLIVITTLSSTIVIKYRNQLKDLVAQNCSDQETQNVLIQIFDQANGKIYKYNLFMLIMIVLINFFYLIGACIILIMNQSEPKAQKVQQV